MTKIKKHPRALIPSRCRRLPSFVANADAVAAAAERKPMPMVRSKHPPVVAFSSSLVQQNSSSSSSSSIDGRSESSSEDKDAYCVMDSLAQVGATKTKKISYASYSKNVVRSRTAKRAQEEEEATWAHMNTNLDLHQNPFRHRTNYSSVLDTACDSLLFLNQEKRPVPRKGLTRTTEATTRMEQHGGLEASAALLQHNHRKKKTQQTARVPLSRIQRAPKPGREMLPCSLLSLSDGDDRDKNEKGDARATGRCVLTTAFSSSSAAAMPLPRRISQHQRIRAIPAFSSSSSSSEVIGCPPVLNKLRGAAGKKLSSRRIKTEVGHALKIAYTAAGRSLPSRRTGMMGANLSCRQSSLLLGAREVTSLQQNIRTQQDSLILAASAGEDDGNCNSIPMKPMSSSAADQDVHGELVAVAVEAAATPRSPSEIHCSSNTNNDSAPLLMHQQPKMKDRNPKAPIPRSDPSQLAESESSKRQAVDDVDDENSLGSGVGDLSSLFQGRMSLDGTNSAQDTARVTLKVLDGRLQQFPMTATPQKKSGECVLPPNEASVAWSLERCSLERGRNHLPVVINPEDLSSRSPRVQSQLRSISKRSVLSSPIPKVQSKRRDSKKTPGKMAVLERTNVVESVAMPNQRNDRDEACAMNAEEAALALDDDYDTTSSLSDESASETWTRDPQPKLHRSPFQSRNLDERSDAAMEEEKLVLQANQIVASPINEVFSLLDHPLTTDKDETAQTGQVVALSIPVVVDLLDDHSLLSGNDEENSYDEMPNARVVRNRSRIEDLNVPVAANLEARRSRRDRKVTDRFTIAAHTAGGHYLRATELSELAPRVVSRRPDRIEKRKDEACSRDDTENRRSQKIADRLAPKAQAKACTEQVVIDGSVQAGSDWDRISAESKPNNVLSPVANARPRRDRKKTDFFHNSLAADRDKHPNGDGAMSGDRSDASVADDSKGSPDTSPSQTRCKNKDLSPCSNDAASHMCDVANRNDGTANSVRWPQRDRKKTHSFMSTLDGDLSASDISIPCGQSDGSEPNDDSDIADATLTNPVAPVKVEPRRLRIVKRKPPVPIRRLNAKAVDVDGWTVAQLEQLRQAHERVDPTSSIFWIDVASLMDDKSAAECRIQWFSSAKTPAPKISKRNAVMKAAEKPLSEDEDDIFNSTPMRGYLLPNMDLLSIKSDKALSMPTTVADARTEAMEKYGLKSNFRPMPVNKAYLQRMKRDVARAEKDSKGRKPDSKFVVKSAKSLTESVYDHGVDIKVRLSPGGTLKVESQADDDDDVWNEVYDAEDEEEMDSHW